jgi:ATP-dependent DNA helicase DinG
MQTLMGSPDFAHGRSLSTDAGLDAALRSIFSEGGSLSRHLPSYRPRPQQLDMAQRVSAAIRLREVLVCEAGTGTGKTLAYLIPALLSGAKVIVSTGTKTLQDQLYHRDLPVARRALNVSVTTALLKGRANYVCHYHLQRNLLEGRLASREEVSHLQAIARFARITRSGDCGELAEVPENSPAWSLATSTRESCLGQQCPEYGRCFVMAARRAALAAEVVVVNHHLFFADVMLKDEGLAELLPACDTVILDEAHQLPQTATLFFGETLTSGHIIELARDARVSIATVAADTPELPSLAAKLEKAVRDLRLAAPQQSGRVSGAALAGNREFSAAIGALAQALRSLTLGLGDVAERDAGLTRCAARSAEILQRLENWIDPEARSKVSWLEVFSHSLALHLSPLSVAEIFRGQIDDGARAWILTSATLAVAGDFAHYRELLGLDHAHTANWGSPFDYAMCARMYVPRGLPAPGSFDHTDAVVKAALPLIHTAGGSAFLLFTTLRAMRHAHELLAAEFLCNPPGYPLLCQGEGSRSELLERFRLLGNGVLVASASFWEGVDVRGEALRLVVIDKLPFAPPDDPVLEERLKRIAQEGRNGFMDYQLPQAVITLKQGAGRLIRGEHDRGVLMICDPRLVSKSYGRTMIASLPPMRLTRDAAEVMEFLAKR